MIDWKSIPKIDAHIHLLPPDVIENNWGNGDRFVEYGSVDDYLAHGSVPYRSRLRHAVQ